MTMDESYEYILGVPVTFTIDVILAFNPQVQESREGEGKKRKIKDIGI
jgi:hypothetical protein